MYFVENGRMINLGSYLLPLNIREDHHRLSNRIASFRRNFVCSDRTLAERKTKQLCKYRQIDSNNKKKTLFCLILPQWLNGVLLIKLLIELHLRPAAKRCLDLVHLLSNMHRMNLSCQIQAHCRT